MAKKEGLSLSDRCQGRKRAENEPHSLPWQRCSLGAQVAPQRCLTRSVRSSAAILPCWFVFASGWFFNVKMVGFSL